MRLLIREVSAALWRTLRSLLGSRWRPPAGWEFVITPGVYYIYTEILPCLQLNRKLFAWSEWKKKKKKKTS